MGKQKEDNIQQVIASPIPQVPKRDADSVIRPSMPLDHEYTHGIFVKLNGEDAGEEFALCVTAPDGYENTHFLKNSAHFWSGRADDFKLQFDRK